jgi:hypothetical protein
VKKIPIVSYYFFIGVLLSASTIFVPFLQAEAVSDIYVNARLSELKIAKNTSYLDEKSDEVNQILHAGTALTKSEYKNRSGKYGLLSCAVALGLTLLLTFTRSSDVIWIGAFFTILYVYGSMSTEFYIATALLSLIAYYIKKRITPRSKNDSPRTP